MTVGDDSGEDTAYVERDRHCMTIHGQHAVTLNIPAGVKSAIVIEGFYQYGVETKQVNSNSQTDAATMKVIPSSAIESHHVVVCEVSVPTGAKAITANMISEDKRIAGGIDLASHIDVTKDPHKQYAFRKIKINTVGPLRGGHDLSEDLTLTVDPSTVGTAGVVQLEDGSTSNSIVKAPTAYALTRERMRAEGAEAELTQNLADTEVRVKAYADGKANEAEGHARVYADQVGATTLASAKTYADNVSRQAQANAEAVAIQQVPKPNSTRIPLRLTQRKRRSHMPIRLALIPWHQQRPLQHRKPKPPKAERKLLRPQKHRRQKPAQTLQHVNISMMLSRCR